MSKEYRIKTWGCEMCSYTQDFEPTKELMEKHHNLNVNICPSCKKCELTAVTDESKAVKVTVIDEADVDKEIEDINQGIKDGIKPFATKDEEIKYKQEKMVKIQEATNNLNLQ